MHMNHRWAWNCAILKGVGETHEFLLELLGEFFWVTSLLCLLQQEDLFIFLTNFWEKMSCIILEEGEGAYFWRRRGKLDMGRDFLIGCRIQ